MNAEQRQALREKHHKMYENDDDSFCIECYTPYPCDVIKVLDATENLKSSDLKTEVECEHLDHAYIHHPDGFAIGDGYIGMVFDYCPKCGEKL